MFTRYDCRVARADYLQAQNWDDVIGIRFVLFFAGPDSISPDLKFLFPQLLAIQACDSRYQNYFPYWPCSRCSAGLTKLGCEDRKDAAIIC